MYPSLTSDHLIKGATYLSLHPLTLYGQTADRLLTNLCIGILGRNADSY